MDPKCGVTAQHFPTNCKCLSIAAFGTSSRYDGQRKSRVKTCGNEPNRITSHKKLPLKVEVDWTHRKKTYRK